MLSLKDFVSKLSGNIQQRDIYKSIASIMDTIADNNDIIISVDEFMDGKTINDSNIKKLEKDFLADLKEAGVKNVGNFFNAIKMNHEKVMILCPVLKKLVRDNLATDNYQSAMTYDKATLIRLIELFDFSINYSLKLMHYLLNVQSASFKDSDEKIHLTAGEIKNIVTNLSNWTSVLSIVLPIKNLEDVINKIPSIEISRDWVSGTVSDAGEKDPLKLGFVGVSYNPFYYAQRWAAEWSVEKNRADKERKRVMELRLYHLKNQYNESPDPAMEMRINKMEVELSKIEYSIKQFEDDLNE